MKTSAAGPDRRHGRHQLRQQVLGERREGHQRDRHGDSEAGFVFSSWTGACTGNRPTCTTTVNASGIGSGELRQAVT